MKDLKLYDVSIGQVNAGGDNHTVSGLTILAVDVEEALKKTKKDRTLEKGEYIESCRLVRVVDYA